MPGVLPHHRLSLILLHLRVPGQHQHSQLTTSFTILYCDECVQAGLVGLLVARYKLPILVSVAYLSLSISYHVASLNTRWYQPQSYWWTDQLLALFVVHRSGGVQHPASSPISQLIFMRDWFQNGYIQIFLQYANYFPLHPLMIIVLVSALYYYCYKRAGLSIADPRFYEDLSWVKEEKLSR